MIKQKLPIASLTPITVWVTPNVKVYRQLGFWHDTKKSYQFIPTAWIGYMIVTETKKEIECKPLLGYSIYRPAALNLSWSMGSVVDFRKVSMTLAMELHDKHPEKWKRIHA